MSVLEAQMAELTQKLKESEERQERNDTILRELLCTREDVQCRGREAPVGAEEVETSGTGAAPASSSRVDTDAVRGVSRSSDPPTAYMVSSKGVLSRVYTFGYSGRNT